MDKRYVMGVDFGTDSVRAVLIDADDGNEISSAVAYYKRWKDGLYCDPLQNRFRQHPLDYITSLETAIRESLQKAPAQAAACLRAISIDTTGSTPVAVNQQGTPLALTEPFKDDPDAMFILWKDHTAVAEAEEINAVAHTWGGIDYTKYSGGVYSSEWFWAKLLHIIRHNPAVRKAAYSWVEHCDWIAAYLTGNTDPGTIKRSRCAAGHKAMWHESFGGLPAGEFLVKIDPLLAGVRERLFAATFTSDIKMGNLSQQWAEKLGLSTGVAIGVGAFDAHMGAVGGEIAPGVLCKIMGTSTCDMLVAPYAVIGGKLIQGICGQVDGSIIPGMTGLEAGQSAFGDIYAWFADLLSWPARELKKAGQPLLACTGAARPEEIPAALIRELSAQAAGIKAGAAGILAVHWMNGRRTPFADQALKGAILGLSLGSSAPAIFRSLVEATAFGSRKIADCFREQGVAIDSVIAMGGVAKKSPFVMQVAADVMDMQIKVVRCGEACALGAAMFAAVAAGIYGNITEAQQKMGNGFETVYYPDPANAELYKALYGKYNAACAFIENQSRAK